MYKLSKLGKNACVNRTFFNCLPCGSAIGVLFGAAAMFATSGVSQAQGLTTLASFNGTDGDGPSFGNLTLSGNTLYGTTEYGGEYGAGEVFSVPINGGAPNVLASFDNTDGQRPMASLTLFGSTFYSTTTIGGASVVSG